MKVRQHHDLSISELGVGCYALSGVYGRKDPGEFIQMLHRACEMGVTFFDTAAAYGEDAERVLGEGVASYRNEVIIATKIGPSESGGPDLSPQHIRASCERSLRNLGTDWIDVYQVLYDDPNTPVEVTIGALEDLQREGKIRHYGLSHLPLPRVEQYLQSGRPSTMLMELSAVSREARSTLLPLCRAHGLAGIAFSPTGRGLLTGRFDAGTTFPPGDLRRIDPLFQRERFSSGLRIAARLAEIAARHGKTPVQAAIAWVLAQPGIVCALSGPSTIEHLEENAGGTGWEFDAEEMVSFERFLSQEEAGLRRAQHRAVHDILAAPLPPDTSQAFTDLVYAVETAILLGLFDEADVIAPFRELFGLQNRQDADARRQMVAIQARLREMLPAPESTDR